MSGLADAYDAHVWAVYGYIGYRVMRREDVEDLTQQTFERAAKSWEKFDPGKASVRTWLLAIARNLVIDHFRASRPEQGLPDGDTFPEDTRNPDPAEVSVGISPELAAAIGRLSQRDREVIALRFGGEMTGAEIAEAIDMSVANVQQILSRSLRKLRSELEAPTRAT